MTDVCRPTLLFPAALPCWCYHVFLHSGWAPQTSGLGTFAEGGIKGQASQMPFLQFLQDQGVAVWDAWIPHCEYSFRELKARLGAFTLPWVKQGTQGTLVVRFHHLLSCRLVVEAHRVRIVLAALLISSSCSGGSIVDWVSSFICEKANNKITTTNWKVQWCAQSDRWAVSRSLEESIVSCRPAAVLACLTPKEKHDRSRAPWIPPP